VNQKTQSIELQDSTIKYLEALCLQYDLSQNSITHKGLELAELNLAEFEARKAALQRD